MNNPVKPPDWTLEQAAHLLNRAGFGGSPSGIDKFHKQGRDRAVQVLLNGDEESDLFPAPLTTLPWEMIEYYQVLKAMKDGPEKFQAKVAFLHGQNDQIAALRTWWVNRMRYTTNPLREKMTLFWHGHFATSFDKVGNCYSLLQQNETFRQYALGNFRQFTGAVSRDPAMMRYLDLDTSSGKKPNENFAREVMELFLLGEGVVYTEKDVQEGARAFTGYRVDPKTGQFRFQLSQFDGSEKHFMGRKGDFGGDDILDIIFQQPECADFIARKVWNFFAGVPLSPGLEQKFGHEFRISNFDISTLLEAIFTSSDFYSPAVMRNQVKSPVQWIVQMSRELEAPLPPDKLYQPALAQMGQTLFAPPNVKGWEGGRSWINSTTFLTRCNLAGTILSGLKKSSPPFNIPWDRLAPPNIRKNPAALCDQLSFRFFNSPLDDVKKAEFVAFLQKRGPVVDDNSVREMVHLMMSTPEYQVT